ncbi:MAG: DUF6141 family protein [Anaerolineales bacterium]|jgi:hypothetical protein
MMHLNFHEEQKISQWWVWMLVMIGIVLGWWGFFQQIVIGQPYGINPGPDWMVVLVWLLTGIGLPLFILSVKLVVTVSADSVEIYFRPFTRRVIPLEQIARFKARTYSPLGEYGGWGLRGLGNNRAYNISGNCGVELVLKDGRIVLIGSRRAEELASAIETAYKTWSEGN